MLWIIGGVSAIVAIIAFIWGLLDLFLDYSFEYSRWVAAGKRGIATVIAVVVTIGCWYGLEGIYNMRYEESNQSGEWTLIALQDNSQIKGQGYGGLFYVRVSIDSVEVYNFYYQLENGGYKQCKITADSAVIFEQDDGTPRFVQYTVDVKNKMPKWLHNTLAFGCGNKQYNTFDLFVPKGSVVQDFTLDLK